MAGADQDLVWWSALAGDPQPQDDTSAGDHQPSLYQNAHTFSQPDGVYQRSYDVNLDQHYSQAERNDIWQSTLPDANMSGLEVVPLPNGVSGLSRPSFHTAPPQPLPPSQVNQLRGYYTGPQPRHAQQGDTAAGYNMPYNQTSAVDLNYFVLQNTHGHSQMDMDPRNPTHLQQSLSTNAQNLPRPETSCDEKALSLIRKIMELYPSTFFYPEKLEALAAMTSLSTDTVRRGISQVLEEGFHGPSHITGSSEYSKSSIAAPESLRTTNQSLSSATTDHSQPRRIIEPQDTQPILEHTSAAYALDDRSILQKAAQFLLDSTSRNCRPTSDKSLLVRNRQKKYQCTFKCGVRFTRKDDLRRHEEEKNFPKEGWICDVNTTVIVEGVSTCAYCGQINPSMSHAQDKHRNRAPFCHEKEISASGKIFMRKKHFVQHCKTFHPALNVAEFVNRCHFVVPSVLPKWCGFCEQHLDFDGPKARNHHMAGHFEEEGLDMTKWKDPIMPCDIVADDEDDDGDDDGDDGSDIDGDGDESNLDTDHEMDEADDEADDQDNTDHEYQSNGGSSDGAGGQKPSGNIRASFSALAIDDLGHTSTEQAIISLRQPCGTNLRNDLAISENIPVQKGWEVLPLPIPGENHNHGPSINRFKLSSASLQDYLQGEEPGRQRNRSSGTSGSTMEEDLWNARVTYKSHRSFIPYTELNRLITVESVSQELHAHNSEIIPEEMANKAKIIVKDATRLFALLMLIGKGQHIIQLMEEGIKDDDLPISGSRCKEIRTFSQWKPKAVEDFKQDQWSVISPIFSTAGLHYELDDHTILPFIENKERPEQLISGGYSDVRSVKIHPAHLDLFSSKGVSHSAPLIAVKRLHSTDHIDFEKEARMLRELAKRDHPHIIKLLATYRLGGHYHLMFPWADKNLRRYWQDDPKPRWDQKALLWDIRQMLGIASGLQTIHNFKDKPLLGDHPPCLSVATGEEEYRYGRHGDLKPENILWSNESDDFNGPGILQIADFGLGRFHGRASRSQVDPRTIASTPTYEPPEIALSLKVSRAYDIWSLGCLYLEYITWRLGGYKLLEAFGNARLTRNEDGVIYDKFYTLQDNAQGSPLSQLPTRVLNVGDADTDPYIQETAGDYGHYAALSYCWGTKSRITSTTESIQERKRCIPLSILPTMFRDAITICRTSGVRYLWIDSLCIIQDSREDWEAEIRKMSNVYQKALFIIAATAEKCGEGISIKPERKQALGPIKFPGPDIRKTCVVHEAVLQWINRLRGHSRCSRVIHDLLNLIEDELLVVDARKRITSTKLLVKLQGLASRAEVDRAYLLSPAPRDVFLELMENSHCMRVKRNIDFTDGKGLLNRLDALQNPADKQDAVTLPGLGSKHMNQMALGDSLGFMYPETSYLLWLQSLTTQRVPGLLPEDVLKPMIFKESDKVQYVKDRRMVIYMCSLKRGAGDPRLVVYGSAGGQELAYNSVCARPIGNPEGNLLALQSTLRRGKKFLGDILSGQFYLF